MKLSVSDGGSGDDGGSDEGGGSGDGGGSDEGGGSVSDGGSDEGSGNGVSELLVPQGGG